MTDDSAIGEKAKRAQRPLPTLSEARRQMRTYRSILDESNAFAPPGDDPYPDNHGPVEPHYERDKEKLRLHEKVAEHLLRDPEHVLDIARSNLRHWQAASGPEPYYEKWEHILATSSVDEIVSLITEDSERGRDLRQSTPFVGVISPAERDAIMFGRLREPPGRK